MSLEELLSAYVTRHVADEGNGEDVNHGAIPRHRAHHGPAAEGVALSFETPRHRASIGA